ncbi:hypothetical protein [Microbacterium tenebrionis]|nr:hypothetical protein [Microbacterium tenebrionis]
MTLWAFGTLLIPFLVGLGIRDLFTRRARTSITEWNESPGPT